MRTLIIIGSSLLAALAFSTAAGAAGPQHFSFTEHDIFLDDTCSFPIVADFVSKNDITEFDNADGTVAALQLHQTFVGTWTGNGVALTENDHEQTFVTFAGGTATQAKHVGLILHLAGPDGRLFQVAGQLVFTVVNGFDRDLLTAHGIAIDFDPATYCPAFD